jgi:hypothetical protein
MQPYGVDGPVRDGVQRAELSTPGRTGAGSRGVVPASRLARCPGPLAVLLVG